MIAVPPAATSTLDGPIREYYLVGLNGTADDSRWQTEIGWPIFQTGTILLTGTGP